MINKDHKRTVEQLILDLDEPGKEIQLTVEQANELGAFKEDALTEDEARDGKEGEWK